MAANAAAGAAAAEGDELDIRQLQGKQDKIRDLMRRDPRFIGRLIVVGGGAGSHRGLRGFTQRLWSQQTSWC